MLYKHKSHHAMKKEAHHTRHAIYQERQQIIYRLGGHCGKLPLSFFPFLPTPFASIDHSLRKRVCGSNAVIRIWAALANSRTSVGWELILDTKLGHFYHGLSSIYNLKAWPEASIAGLLIAVLLHPGE